MWILARLRKPLEQKTMSLLASACRRSLETCDCWDCVQESAATSSLWTCRRCQSAQPATLHQRRENPRRRPSAARLARNDVRQASPCHGDRVRAGHDRLCTNRPIRAVLIWPAAECGVLQRRSHVRRAMGLSCQTLSCSRLVHASAFNCKSKFVVQILTFRARCCRSWAQTYRCMITLCLPGLMIVRHIGACYWRHFMGWPFGLSTAKC